MEDVRLHWVAVGLGAAALALVAAGLAARSGEVLGWGLAALGAEYAVHFSAAGRALDEVTPVYAAAFVLAAELAFWSVEPRVAAWSEPGLIERRLVYLTVTSAAAAGVAAAVLVVASASGGGGLALEAIGIAAAIGAFVLLAALVHRSLPEVDSRS